MTYNSFLKAWLWVSSSILTTMNISIPLSYSLLQFSTTSVAILLMPIFIDLFYYSCQFETSNELDQVCTSEERQAFNEKLDEVRIFFWWYWDDACHEAYITTFLSLGTRLVIYGW